MNELSIFQYEQQEVRTVQVNGEPWFVAKDVCDILELSNPSMAIESLDEDERAKFNLGRQGDAWVINEPGLYSLILRSRKPEAKAFKRWITHEVIPSIRKTGGYSTSPPSQDIPLPKLSASFRALKAIAATAGLKGNPATISADSAMRRLFGVSPLGLLQIELKSDDQERLLTPTELARIAGAKSGQEMDRTLAALGLQEKVDGQWVPTERGKNLSVLVDTTKRHNSGAMITQVKWKPSVLTIVQESASA